MEKQISSCNKPQNASSQTCRLQRLTPRRAVYTQTYRTGSSSFGAKTSCSWVRLTSTRTTCRRGGTSWARWRR